MSSARSVLRQAAVSPRSRPPAPAGSTGSARPSAFAFAFGACAVGAGALGDVAVAARALLGRVAGGRVVAPSWRRGRSSRPCNRPRGRRRGAPAGRSTAGGGRCACSSHSTHLRWKPRDGGRRGHTGRKSQAAEAENDHLAAHPAGRSPAARDDRRRDPHPPTAVAAADAVPLGLRRARPLRREPRRGRGRRRDGRLRRDDGRARPGGHRADAGAAGAAPRRPAARSTRRRSSTARSARSTWRTARCSCARPTSSSPASTWR